MMMTTIDDQMFDHNEDSNKQSHNLLRQWSWLKIACLITTQFMMNFCKFNSDENCNEWFHAWLREQPRAMIEARRQETCTVASIDQWDRSAWFLHEQTTQAIHGNKDCHRVIKGNNNQLACDCCRVFFLWLSARIPALSACGQSTVLSHGIFLATKERQHYTCDGCCEGTPALRLWLFRSSFVSVQMIFAIDFSCAMFDCLQTLSKNKIYSASVQDLEHDMLIVRQYTKPLSCSWSSSHKFEPWFGRNFVMTSKSTSFL